MAYRLVVERGTIQRQSVPIPYIPGIPNLLDPLESIFEAVVLSNVLMASIISIPINWFSFVTGFFRDNMVDGLMLLRAFARFPSFYNGGWILSTQPSAGAMTLDRAIFVRGGLTLSTFVHELVHVFQYGLLGRTPFLVSYFGVSAATIAYRWINRLPLDVMRSSIHESQAYGVETDFDSWYMSKYGVDPNTIIA